MLKDLARNPPRSANPVELAVAAADRGASHDSVSDVAAGIGGAAIMALAWLTPFMRPARNHWGLPVEAASEPRPGDELVREPRWSWTHAVQVEAPADEVWPWVAQVGADRGGFYSYQWLENLAGCDVRNAEIRPPSGRTPSVTRSSCTQRCRCSASSRWCRAEPRRVCAAR